MTEATQNTNTETTTTVEELRNQAAAKREAAANAIAKAEQLEAQAAALAVVFDTAVGSAVKAKRRNGDVVDGTFQGAKDTGRGILVAVQVGDGFDAEVLKLPLSSVTFGEAEGTQELITNPESDSDPLAGI